jgi:hypothetical protein
LRGILEALWGWQAKSGKESGQVFDRASIGRAKYGQTHATLSCSLERLRQRGLIRIFKDVTRYGTLAGLTTFGTQVAKELAEAEREEEEAGPE